MIRVLLHGAWRGFAGGAREVRVEAPRLRDEHGKLRAHLAVFVNEDDARLLGWEDAMLKDGDVVHIIPALSGGSK